MVKLYRCVGSFNTLNDLSDKVCVSNKTEDYRNKSINTLAKNISCKCKCKFDERKCYSDQWRNKDNVDVSLKNVIYVKKLYLEFCYT